VGDAARFTAIIRRAFSRNGFPDRAMCTHCCSIAPLRALSGHSA
jgi:hypothetical protein